MTTPFVLAQKARQRIAPHVRVTPLERSLPLSRLTGADVWLRVESYQVTGSFKARGALSRLTSLPRDRSIVTASSGNHGAAVAYGASRLGLSAVVYVPENASPVKVAKIEGYGAAVRLHGDDSGLAEIRARKVADETGAIYVSPYNDELVVAGQATLALELLEQAPEGGFDAVMASVGGGGLIGGIAGVFAAESPTTLVLGASPQNSCDMYESVKVGRIVTGPSLPTLSDGTAGAIEEGTITLAPCMRYVGAWELVSEDEIRQAMRLIVEHHQILVEGSAAVPLAALRKQSARFAGKRVALVLCGANVALATLQSVLSQV